MADSPTLHARGALGRLTKHRTGSRPVMNRKPAEQGLSIGDYLIHRLADYVQDRPRSGLRILKRIIDNGQAYALSKAVENAKIKLSNATTATVELFRPDAGINIQEEICRDDFDMSISDDLNQVFEVIDRTLRDAEITSRDVDQVILTGGSCKIPAFRQRVRSKFRSSRISDASVASRVALGLAQEARRLWS